MGRAIQARLAGQGAEVIGWDSDALAMETAAENGMAIAAHPRAVAHAADTVISIITEDHGVRTVFHGPDGYLSGDVRGKLFIEMATVTPEAQIALAKAVRAAGAAYVECPVSGSVIPARAGKLLGTLRDRAKDTAKGFSEGYQSEVERPPAEGKPNEPDGTAPRPRPRPRRD